MAETLKVDTASVRTVSVHLTTISQELTDAQAHSDSVASAVGHDGLAGALRDFSGSWDDRRRKLVEQVANLRDAATAIANGLDDTDNALARALSDSSSSHTTPYVGTAGVSPQ